MNLNILPFNFFFLAFIFFFISLIEKKSSFKENTPNYVVNKSEEKVFIKDTLVKCPPEGNAKTARLQELNVLKNRVEIPDEKDFNYKITLDKILNTGEDEDRWENSNAAVISGYVIDVKPGGIETCNCKDKDMRDTHIEIVSNPMDKNSQKAMVVEVTPRLRKAMQKKGIDWSTKTLRTDLLGRWVEFKGWMLFDAEHKNAAENTNPGRERNWRATAWEIHPVTGITVLEKRR